MSYCVKYSEDLNAYELVIKGKIFYHFETKEGLIRFLKEGQFPEIDLALKDIEKINKSL
jgi:flagellar basal body rod protein FlgG